MQYVIIVFLFLANALYGQVSPTWLNPDVRAMRYPGNLYVTGFVQDNLVNKEKIDTKLSFLAKAAQAKVVENILVKVTNKVDLDNSIQRHEANRKEDLSERNTSTFYSNTTTSAHADIVGAKVETYYDKANSMAYAFAYVMKSDMIAYYTNVISVNMAQLQSTLKRIKQYANDRMKTKARNEYQQAKILLDNMNYAQNILIALDNNISESVLQIQKTENIRDQIEEEYTNLQRNACVFLKSKEDISGHPVSIIADNLKATLADSGCSFTDMLLQADYKVFITASISQKMGSDFPIFCNADVVVDLYDTFAKKIIYHNRFRQKGGSNSYQRAAEDALEQVSPKIAVKIIEWIKK